MFGLSKFSTLNSLIKSPVTNPSFLAKLFCFKASTTILSLSLTKLIPYSSKLKLFLKVFFVITNNLYLSPYSLNRVIFKCTSLFGSKFTK